ncbi:MAG TPA: SGNH/GDSL hydrolase family protein [Solirubrobacterales bacterium]|jgi:lysophospholipase L1-like esterase|nr:SGNH/GDSL hydrolase family protein [Solirubrobacterales bacterium]
MSVSDPAALAGRAARTVSAYAALGDSFTAGRESAAGERWADRLAAGLRAIDPGLVYANLAVDGAGSAAVLEQLPAALELRPDLVTVICGANDVLMSTRPDVAGYERRFGEILERLRAAVPEAAILTATAPENWHFIDLRPRTKARLVKALRELNAVTRDVAGRHRVPCIDVAGHPGLSERGNFSADGVHPSALGHERASREIALSLRAHFGIRIGDLQGGS